MYQQERSLESPRIRCLVENTNPRASCVLVAKQVCLPLNPIPVKHNPGETLKDVQYSDPNQSLSEPNGDQKQVNLPQSLATKEQRSKVGVVRTDDRQARGLIGLLVMIQGTQEHSKGRKHSRTKGNPKAGAP